MAEPHIPQLLWEPECQPDILLDLNATSIEKSRTIAPLPIRIYGSSDKQSRPTHRFDTLHFPILADHNMKLNRAFNPLLYGVKGIRRIDALEQSTYQQIFGRERLRIETGRHRNQMEGADRDRRGCAHRFFRQSHSKRRASSARWSCKHGSQ